jgi:hypothetical protein
LTHKAALTPATIDAMNATAGLAINTANAMISVAAMSQQREFMMRHFRGPHRNT